jgi:hypothetical protein
LEYGANWFINCGESADRLGFKRFDPITIDEGSAMKKIIYLKENEFAVSSNFNINCTI